MLTQERMLVDIEKEIAQRVESDLKDSRLPAPTDDRKGVGGVEEGFDSHRSFVVCQKQSSKPVQSNHSSSRHAATIDNGSLNFSTSMEDLDVAFAKKPKMVRDPLSHRIIEKRRRDRMNNCLADLSHLIPTNNLKQGQGRIEKTEIIEMAIKHIKNLTDSINQPTVLKSSLPDRYLGFKECQDEVMRYLVEIEGWDAMDKLCTSLMAHLEQAGEKFRIMNDESLSKGAKEEQYRHADEEMGTCHNHMPNVFEVIAQNKGFPSAEMPIYPGPVEQQSMMHGTVQNPQENTPMETQSVFQTLNNFESAQQITRDHLKRDKHLWTLLQNEYNSTSMVDSGLSTDHGSSSSNANEKDKLSEEARTNNSKSLSDSSSGNSSSYGSSSEKTGSSVYKFKHHITKRFSQEAKKENPSDTSSSSSSGDKRAEKGKRKFRHVRSRSPGSSHFINADAMNTEDASNEETDGVTNSEDEKVSNYLPAFVLHPVGTHYIPLSIHPSSIGSNVFTQNSQNVYHPISIPVHFGGPLLYMESVSINSDSCTSLATSSTNSPMGCSGESSSTCNSINSPSSQDSFKAQSS